jgi:membrane protein DedA with SNARE-associated domain
MDSAEWVAFLRGLPPVGLYLAIWAVAYLENVLPPIPGDVVVVFGGYLAGLGMLNPWGLWFGAVVASTLGFMTMYRIGYRLGPALFSRRRFLFLSNRHLRAARRWLIRYGLIAVVVNRFLSGTRSVISLVAGLAHMPLGPVTIAAALSTSLWTGLLIALGYWLGDRWQEVSQYLSRYSQLLLLVLVAGVSLYVALRLLRRRREKTGPAESG